MEDKFDKEKEEEEEFEKEEEEEFGKDKEDSFLCVYLLSSDVIRIKVSWYSSL